MLGQRFPQEVDAEVGKLTRYVARCNREAAAEALQEGDDEEDGDGDGKSAVTERAKREAFREKALSSLLVSTFAGAELAQHLPLQQEVCFVMLPVIEDRQAWRRTG